MIDDARVYEILTEICEGVTAKRSKRGFIARCPVCGDSKKTKRIRRLHVDYYSKHDDWAITCYNGGCPFRSGNVYSLYATVKGVSYGAARKYIKEDVYDPEAITKTLSASPKPAVKESLTAHEAVDLDESDVVYCGDNPTDKIEQRYHGMLVDFILDRKIPPEYSDKLCVAFDGRYKGRVIIPIYLNSKMMYFQGRALFDNIEPKYLNPDVDKDMIISNSDKFSRDKHIIVTEGLIDSWMVEHNQGTSINGGYFSDELIEVLLSMTDKGVILVPDNPIIDKAGREELIKYMNEGRYSGKVDYFLMGDDRHKDLNELVINLPQIQVYDHIVHLKTGKFATEMALNLSGW